MSAAQMDPSHSRHARAIAQVADGAREIFSVFSKLDLLVCLATLAFLAIAFEHGLDIFHTIGASVAYLNGHFLDFYEVVKVELGLEANYLPSTYAVFALWALPLRLLGRFQEVVYPGWSFLWFKVLTSLVYLATALVVHRIGLQLGFSRRHAILLAAAWATTPIAIFSQFIFGQYDILTVFFMLLGVLAYFRN